MKLILNEEQYNRLFNNVKRKLIITESQYEQLLLEKDRISRKEKKRRKKAGEVNPQPKEKGEKSKPKSNNINTNISGINKGDTVKLVSGSNDLHFRVVAKRGDEFMMINCNSDSVYKNAYFYITGGDALSTNGLTYSSAQNKDIEASNPWDTLETKPAVWRKSIFKNLSDFDVFTGGDGGLTCNLDDDAIIKFGIDMKTGKVKDTGTE